MKGEPTQHDFHGSQVRLTYFQWGARGNTDAEARDAPTVLLVHATGFHARCWDRTVAALPDGYRAVAVDMRGHGRSDKHAPYVWATFGRDLEELVRGLGIRDAIGVGHSMGGHCVTQVAARVSDAFRRLVLVDPVIFEPAAYPADRYRGYDAAEDHPVARRRDLWASWEEMYERFRDRHPFSLWRPEVLEDYCRYGVLPRADGAGYELACPPLVEASVYLGNTQTDVHDLIPCVTQPVVVMRARARSPEDLPELDFSRSPTWPGLADAFPDGRDVYLPELTHFIPMQDPELVARFIVDPKARP